jgi:2,5-diketo-D-gluconate reductase A
MRAVNAARGILTESWSPLEHGRALTDPTIAAIAERHACSPAAIVLRWHLDLGLVVIPKAASPAHLAANIAALELTLTDVDHAEIAALARADGGFGPDPLVHTTEQGA